MIQWLKNQWLKHKAKRIFQEYATRTDSFDLGKYGKVQFANWLNPLVLPKQLDEEMANFFKPFISEGDTVLDIGANIGHMAIPMALVAGVKGQVIAFDPNPVVFKILDQNARLNPEKTRIHAYNLAISHKASTFYYSSSEASFNNGGISETPESRHGKYTLPKQINGVVLADFLQEHFSDSLPSLRLIKIDTEGYDKEIVASILPLIRKYKPTLISECFGRLSDKEKMDYFRLLSSEGYRLSYFSAFSDQAQIVPITSPEGMLQWKHFDFFARYTV
jgi:FkbM family methyltransferase